MLCDHGMDNTFYFQWHITDKCNLNCKHCYQKSTTGYSDLKLQELKIMCDKIDSACKKWGVLSTIALTGGEPFCRRTDLRSLMEYIESKNNVKEFDLLSNGLLIGLQDIQWLKAFPKLKKIQLSLDGHNVDAHEATRGDGTFNETVEAINMLKANNFTVSVMMTLSRLNYLYLSEIYKLLDDLHVDFFAIDRFIPNTNDYFSENVLTRDEIKDVYQQYKDLSLLERGPRILTCRPLLCLLNEGTSGNFGAMCSAGVSSLTILPDGTVFPCRRLPVSIGNILHESVYKIWYDSQVLWDLRDKNKLKGKCRNCSYLSSCSGCRAMAYAVYNDYLMEDPLCWKE